MDGLQFKMLAHFLHVSCHSKAEESPDRDLLKNRSWAPIWTAGKSTTDSWGWIKRGWNNKKIKHVISTIIVIVSSLSVMVLYQTQIILYNSRQHYTRDQTGTLPKTNSSPLKVGLLLPPKRTCPSSNHWFPGVRGMWAYPSPHPQKTSIANREKKRRMPVPWTQKNINVTKRMKPSYERLVIVYMYISCILYMLPPENEHWRWIPGCLHV